MQTGLLFGSFNPVHTGHLIIATFMVDFVGLDEVWFIVSPQNPLKERDSLVNETHRYEMVKKALEKYPQLKESDIEFDMPRPSYTIDTLKKLENDYPEREFAVIIGTDNIDNIDRWKDYKEVVSYRFYIYPRLGSKNEKLSLFSNAKHISAPVVEISSRFIRKAAGVGKEFRPYLPAEVYEYIKDNKLYSRNSIIG